MRVNRTAVAVGLVGAVVLLALFHMSCRVSGGDQTQSVIVTFPDGTFITLTPTPGGTPAPQGTGSGACIAPSVRVNPFGYSCNGSVPVPSNTSGVLPRGCTAVVTATPKYGDGRDVPAELHGPNVAWSITAGQNVVTLSDFPGEPFNKILRPLSDTTEDPGDRSIGFFTVTATVCGTTGTYTAQVI